MNFRRVRFTEDAVADLEALGRQDRRLLVQALRVAKRVEAGRLHGKQLRYFSKTGDLSDCFRVYFGATEQGDTHRMVFREQGGDLDLVEVVAVAERRHDIAYLVAALRLDRIDDPIAAADARRRIALVRRRR